MYNNLKLTVGNKIMNKKFLATLIVGVVAATSIIGFTACNDNGGGSENGGNDGDDLSAVVKGVQVDAEGWAKAFEATLAAESYTVKLYREDAYKASGTDDELGEINLSVIDTRNGTAYYDGNTYGKTKVKVVATGIPDDEDWQKLYQNQEYDIESYIAKDGETYYSAYYSTQEEDAEWSVSTLDTIDGSTIDVLNSTYATDKDGTANAALTDLYEAFTYADGVYNATLWQYGVETAVSVSVKDGYVVSYSTEYLYKYEYEGYTHSDGLKVVYNFSNFGSSTVNASDAAKKAVEDYKAANA